ncbi:MAG: TonB-dependent receptor [Chitinophagaceae bacterium]
MLKTLSLAGKACLCGLFLLFLHFTADAQKTVTGKIFNSKDKQPLQGATVVVKGTSSGTQTDAAGAFKINVPSDNSVLVVTAIGFERLELATAGKTDFTVEITATAAALNEIVVTGYTSQRKKDIIGAVSVVSAKDLQATPASNLAVQLQGRAAGVTISSSGEPGAGAVVRIRGFASAGNNDPLYVIDGVPTDDPSKLNPNDVESLQVLKDASSASIYGSRASNGVIIVTTKQGKAGRASLSYDGYVGKSVITDKMMPDMLNTAQYLDYLQKTTPSSYVHPVFGKNGSFAIPDFYITSTNFKGGVSGSDPKANPNLYNIGEGDLYQISKTSPGTQWFNELTRPALLTNHQISATGGTDKATYSAGLNYFEQQGTFVETKFKRYTARVNTSFKPVNFLRIGENLQVSYEDRLGGSNRGEGDAWASAFRMVPYVPVYDIKGGFGGNGVGESGNGSNPIANLVRQKDNTDKAYKIFGNVFAEIPFTSYLNLRSSFGIDAGNQFVRNIARRTYERSENQGNTQLTEEGWYYTNWTWTNTLTFQKTFAKNHDLKLLLGTEAVKGNSRGVRAFGQNFDFETADFVSLNTATAGSLSDRTISNYNVGRSSLSSYFGRLDYAFKGKYLLSGTFRRDGSSRFGPNVRYANFPSFGIAWRLSEEAFVRDNVTWLTDLKIRGGWGQMGSQSNVDPNNQFTTFTSNPPRTNYDINGTNTSSFQGYRQDREGNLDTKWETSETTNLGLDATILNGKLDFSIDVYKKDTKDLLVDAVRNGLEPQITKPRINIGTMRNTGFDIALNYKGTGSKDLTYDVGVTFSHYKNTMTKLNNENSPRVIGLERLSSAIRTEEGQPISSFHGFVIDGFYNSAADTAGAIMPTATIGSWKYKDINGDKKIDDNDRTFLGSPHPDFQMGLNLGVNYKNFSFTAFFFWNKGNEIYNYTKYYTDMRVFVGGVSTRVLNDSWTPTHMDASLPALGVDKSNGFTSFTSSTSNSYYVEDGSYFRAKTIQLGYTLPRSLVSRVKLSNVKVYIQAQNLFTITKYTGSDPDIQLLSRDPFGARDYYIGVDLGGFPNPKQFIAGLSVTF